MRRLLATLALAPIVGFVYVTAAPGGMQSGPTATQSAATTPRNGLIGFVNESGAFAVIRPDGTGLRVVAKDAGTVPASWSPDGSRVALVRWIESAKAEAIYVLRMDQAGAVPHRVGQLTPMPAGSGGVQALSWSPTGDALLYTELRAHNTGAVKLLAADGSTTSTLASDDDLNHVPVWSPDGSQIVWTRVLGGATGFSREAEIWIMRSDGSKKVRLTQNHLPDFEATFAPSGRQITYVQSPNPHAIEASIWIMGRDGSHQHAITKTAGASDRMPRFSPDGRWIAFTRFHMGTASEIMLVHPDGSGLHRVANNADIVSFSPDGRYLLIANQNKRTISIKPTTGGPLRHLANGLAATWQPR